MKKKFKVGDLVEADLKFKFDWPKEEIKPGKVYKVTGVFKSSAFGDYAHLKDVYSSYYLRSLKKATPETIRKSFALTYRLGLNPKGVQTVMMVWAMILITCLAYAGVVWLALNKSPWFILVFVIPMVVILTRCIYAASMED